MGFTIRETMQGTHQLLGELVGELQGHGRGGLGHGRAVGSQPFAFRLEWGPERVSDWLNPLGPRFLWQEARGEVFAGGLCDWTPCRGTLELDYFGQRRIRYAFDFTANGVTYRYTGEKVDIRPWNLPVSHTTCFGTLVELETGKLVSTSVTRFRLRDLPRFLGSLRWR